MASTPAALNALYEAWSASVAANGYVTVSEDVFTAAGLVPPSGMDSTIATDLMTSTPLQISVTSISEPSGNTLTVSNGTVSASVLGLTALTFPTVIVSVDGTTDADVSMVISLPATWNFGATFPPLNGDPFNDLGFTSPAFLFTTAASYLLPWNQTTVTATTGLTFISDLDLTEGPLAIAALLLSIADGGEPIVLSGPVLPPAEGSIYPTLSLVGTIDAGPISLGQFSIASPSLNLTSSTDSTGAWSASLSLGLDIEVGGNPVLQVTAGLQSGVSALTIYGTPTTPITPGEVLNALMNGSDFTDSVPSPAVSAFDTTNTELMIGLQEFSCSVLLTGTTPSLLWVEAKIGTNGTTNVGPFGVSALVLEFRVLSNPTVISAAVSANLALSSTLFPGGLDIDIADSDTLTIAGGCDGSVDLTDLITTLVGASAPSGLPDVTFSDFGASFTLGSDDSVSYSFHASAEATNLSILGQTFAIETAFSFQSQPGSSIFGLVGTLLFSTYAFGLTIDLTDTAAGDAAVVNLSWQGAGGTTITLQEVLDTLGLPALSSDVPSTLNLSLSQIGITYDSGTGALTLYANTSFAEIVYVSAQQQWVLLAGFPSVDLSDLPLVGDVLSIRQTLGLNDTTLIVASEAITASSVAAFNAQIPPNYPTVPTAGTAGTVTFSGNLDLGGSTIPLTLPPPPASGAGNVAAAATPVVAGNTVWVTVQQSFGPVTVQKIGLQYVPGTASLGLQVDATIAFGPITLTLIELGVDLSIVTFLPSFSLEGLGVSYSSPPLTIAGTLINLSAPLTVPLDFAGELVVSTETLSLTAIGYYGDAGGSPAMFVFLYAQDDFGGPPAFFVTGLAGGFGYNTNVTIPPLAGVAEFPFIQALNGSGSIGNSNTPVSGVLQALMDSPPTPPWVYPSSGSLWLAAGLTFTSFQLVQSSALLIAQLGNEFVVSLLGTSTAQYPQQTPGSPPPSELYASLTMELEASLQPSQGIFSVEGVLTPSSYVITPACSVTGGFAYYLWFHPNSYSGDFVFTIGGYNPAFVPPSYYPTVPAVGFHWAYGSNVTIAGGAYLALTPAVFMLGGQLDATYEDGNLEAWFDEWADILIRWSPFWFDAEIGISLGASYTLDLLFTKKTISLELGCSLELWGPPTGGTVTVQWWVFSFTFDFGTPKDQSEGATLPQWDTVVQMLPNAAATTGNQGSAPAVALSFQPVQGLISTDSSTWVVQPNTLVFTATTPIPITSVSGDSAPVLDPPPSAFNVHPLGWSGVTSNLDITITPPVSFSVAPIAANFPAALWGSPPENDGQPLPPPTNGQLVAGIAGFTFTAPPPVPGATAGPIILDPGEGTSPILVDILPGGSLPLTATAAGDVPENSTTATVTIHETIGFSLAREAVFSTLAGLGYGVAANDPLLAFANNVNCTLSDEPLLVAAKSREVHP